MKLTLCRTYQNEKYTAGVLAVGGVDCFYTIERGWLHDPDNVTDVGLSLGRRNESCVPCGHYGLTYKQSGIRHYWYLDAPGLGVYVRKPRVAPSHRWGCRIEAANYAAEVQGCVGVGMRQSSEGEPVSESRDAVSKVEEILRVNSGEHTLRIVDAF